MKFSKQLATLSIAATVATMLGVMTTLATSSVSNLTPRPDGGQAKTRTTPTGTECAVFSKEGQLVCTRNFNITDHSKAIARCVALKC